MSATSSIYYRYNGIHKTVFPADAHDVWLFDFLSSDRDYEYDMDNDEAASNILTVFLNYIVFDEKGAVLGVTGVGLKVESVAQLISAFQEKYDRDGQRILLTVRYLQALNWFLYVE